MHALIITTIIRHSIPISFDNSLAFHHGWTIATALDISTAHLMLA